MISQTHSAARPQTAAAPRVALAALLLVYLCLGVVYAVRTPPWQAPDEPAHYNYIAQVATAGCCPVIEAGDWNQDTLRRLTSARFAPELLSALPAIQYEDHQPPLYYALAALIYRLTDGSLIALRLFSVVLGAGVVACAYAVGITLLPSRPAVALGAAAFAAFLPQHLAMLGAVNNDALAEFWIGLGLLAALRYLKRLETPFAVRPWMLGLLIGLCLLTKPTAYFMAGVIPLAVIGRWWPPRPGANLIALARALAVVLIPALVIGGVWWARNLTVYGWPDFLGLARHDAVVADQPRTAERIAEIGLTGYLREGVQTTYQSFWGQFGWMALPLPGWMYMLTGGLLGLAVLGAAAGRLGRRDGDSAGGSRGGWALLTLAAGLAIVQFVYYNTEFLQFQGRYLYPALIPFGLWLALGLDGWRAILPPHPALRFLAPALIGLLAPLALFCAWRILPLLKP